jgi:hyaluronoglucosaminidase
VIRARQIRFAWLLCAGALALVLLAASVAEARPGSPFRWRGVVQAQYGPQFSHRERMELLRFMGHSGFNAYVHAPKDDPYQRTLWRDPYPPAKQENLVREIALAKRLGIDWVPNVSPALAAYLSPGEGAPPGTTPSAPLCFSCPAEIGALLNKFEPFRAAGAGTFMVSFDDVRREFAYPADTDAYGSGDHAYGVANADLLNRLFAALREREPSSRLLTVAADYYGSTDSAYLRGLRETLDSRIEVMWTGPAIESRPFGAADAGAYGRLVGRTPIVWENWTTNDILRDPGRPPRRIFLGPYARARGLAGSVRGFFFDPANEAELNFLPLATAADWMRRPRAYRPRRAFLSEVRRMGGHEAEYLRAFAEVNYSTSLGGSVEAPTFWRLARRLLRASKRGVGDARQAERVRHELRLVLNARRHLRRVKRLRPFVVEAEPFLRSARAEARVGLLATDLLQARSRATLRRLRHAIKRSDRGAPKTYGTSSVFGLAGNRIDRYVKRVRALDRARR